MKEEKSKLASEKEAPLVPPIQPFSPQEISRFTALDLALRSHPELAREGASLLNPRALAKLVHGIKTFQDTHLGRRSKYTAEKSWPITKLPDPIFRSRSAKGPLFSLLLTSYKVKKQQSWKAFDFVSMNRYEDNILLLKAIEKGLINDGWLVRPVCYFDATVAKEKVEEYTKIVTRYGGVVVDELNGLLEGGISIAALTGNGDTKESTSTSTITSGAKEESKDDTTVTNPRRKKRRKNTKTSKKKAEQKQQPQPQLEKQQKRAVTHVIAWDDEEHDSAETIQQEQESAYAHNYDIVEKLYLRTITVIDPKKQNRNKNNIVETNMMETKKKGGRLGGKGKKGKAPNDPNNPLLDGTTPMAFVHWWYLPSSYDEFMLASDVDGDNDIPPKPDGGPWVVSSKFLRDVERYNEWGLEEDYTITDFEKKVTLYKELSKKKVEEAKRLQEKEEQEKKQKALSRKSSKSPTLRLRLTNSTKAATGDQAKQKEAKIGMNPRQIFTGYYDNRTKIKRVVYDGALKVPQEVFSLIHQSMDIIGISKPEKKSRYELPKVGTVLRPSEDLELLSEVSSSDNGFMVTELRCSSSGTTLISNRRCVAKDLLQTKMVTLDVESLPRIRGGGENEAKDDPNASQPKVEPMDTSEDGKTETMNTPTDAQKSDQQQSKESALHSPEDEQNDVDMKVEPNQQVNTNVKKESESESVLDQNVQNASKNELKPAHEIATNTETQTIIVEGTATNAPVKVETLGAESNAAAITTADKVVEVKPKVETTEEVKKVPQTDPPETTSSDKDVDAKYQPDQGMQSQNQLKVDSPSTDSTSQSKPSTNQKQSPSGNEHDKKDEDSNARDSDHTTTQTQVLSSKENEKKDKDTTAGENSEESNKKQEKPKTSAALQIIALKREKTPKDDKGPKPLSGDQEMTCVLPSWYDADKVSSLEKTLLPEWFDQSAKHRTQKTFITTRERMIEVARKSTNKYVTGTAIRRCVPGDAGSLMRMHQFLMSWGFINGSAIGDSAPTVAINYDAKFPSNAAAKTQRKWTSDMVNVLTVAVSSFATKKRKRDDEEAHAVAIDWEVTAERVGRGMTPHDCYNKFMSLTFDNLKPEVLNQMDKEMEIDDVTAVTVDNESKEESSEDLIANLVNGVRPAVAKAAIDASLEASEGDLAETQRASVLASVANSAVVTARKEEDAADRILQEILDQRMSKLENRLSLLDDLECMFDAERMALELERRDLYTLRCRHWFAGDS